MANNLSQDEIIKKMLEDKKVRLATVRRSHYWFFCFYFHHYLKHEMAPFQKEMFAITEDLSVQNAAITSFRGSAKSTIFSLSYPLWAVLGKQKTKYIIIISQTEYKAQQLLHHVKAELESNELLKKDLGPFQEERGQWNTVSLYLPRYKAKIAAVSVEQSIRGLRHNQHRPQLMILDDIEDIESVKTQEGRDKIYNWVTGEAIPAGDRNTRVILVGNLLHNDGILKRLEKNIEEGKMSGIYREFPLLDYEDKPLWPGKFPTMKEIEAERKKGITEAAWQREYLLNIIPDGDQVITEKSIVYYDSLPAETPDSDYRYAATGIDLAISQKETADYTAMVSAKVFGYGEKRKIYILPHPINEKLNGTQILERAEDLSRSLGNGFYTKLFVENAAFQGIIPELLRKKGIPAEGVSVGGQDKRSRLIAISALIESGKVLFPRKGAERPIQQIIGFGTEKHDDLADALTLLVNKIIMDEGKESGYLAWLKEKTKNAKISYNSKDISFWQQMAKNGVPYGRFWR